VLYLATQMPLLSLYLDQIPNIVHVITVYNFLYILLFTKVLCFTGLTITVHWTFWHLIYIILPFNSCGPGSSVGIVTGYWLDGPGIESRWGQDFPHLSILAPGPTQLRVQWVPGLSRGVKSGWGVTLTSHPLLVPWSWKGRAIPLLPLWAVRPVQSLSACTRVHFTFTF
jgi:hypothetical protein